MINIKRDSSYADKLRSYKVILDGEVVGELADGQSKSFNVEPGTHTLYMKIDWARSNKLTFRSAGTQTLNFRCGSNLKGAKVFLAIVYATILPHKYINLERID